MKITATLALLAGMAGAAATPPTADEILERNLAALGGRERIRAVRSLRFEATQWSGGVAGRSVPVTVYWKRPDRIRIESPEEGILKVVAFDGTTAWSTYPELPGFAPEVLSGAARESLREQADLLEGPTFDYTAKGHRVELVGRERIGGSEAWRLLLTTAGGERRTLWFDCTTYLEVREERAQATADGELANVSILSDYRPAGGLLFAHRMESRLRAAGEPPDGAGETSLFAIGKVELDVELPDSLFSPPAPAAPAR